MKTVKDITDELSTLSDKDLQQVHLVAHTLIDQRVAALKTAQLSSKLTTKSAVQTIMDNVTVQWDEDIVDACFAHLKRALPKAHVELEVLRENAGDLSNDRCELERGKLDEDEEEEYYEACSALHSALNDLVGV